jgi:CHAT domain-containing protein
LWPVDDIGATELMDNFYRSYRSGRSRARALRDAQMSLIEKGGDNADPFVWAAFTVVGAWR